MYRDIVHRPEDHDRAVGAIQIADGLIAGCMAAAAVLRGPERPERWGAARALQDDYPEIWTQLDGARRLLAARGANTAGYDEVREQATPMLAVAKPDGTHVVDAVALDDARRAIEELRLAIPGADWGEIDARSQKLAATRLERRSPRAAIACTVIALALLATAWSTAFAPRHRGSTGAALMNEQIEVVMIERRFRIGRLAALIGDTCDRPRVLELMRLFVMDGQFELAKVYADGYESRCGEDMAVRNWGNAPKPKPRES